jgi:hypothetical protein
MGFLSLSFSGRPYYTVLLSMTLLGFGMTVTVAPLTAAVLNAVPANRTGVASGINNAVASVGSLLLIAALGALATGVLNHSLDRRLAAAPATPAVAQAVQAARGGFVLPPVPESLSGDERSMIHSIVADSLIDTVRIALWIAAVLSLLSAVVAAFTVTGKRRAATPAGP